MTEPQDVLADLLRRLDGWAGDAATRYERADEMVDVARRELRAALVRTPETLDVETGDTELAWKVYGIVDRHRAAFPDAQRWQRIGRDVSEAVNAHAEAAIAHALAAAPSPTPPEGLRAAVALIAADWFDTGYENGRLDHGVLADRLFAALAASPAPDPGAGLRATLDDPEVVRLRDAIYDAVSGYEPTLMLVVDLQNAILAALAPSAEPPETETA